jgi:hypothetical protein
LGQINSAIFNFTDRLKINHVPKYCQVVSETDRAGSSATCASRKNKGIETGQKRENTNRKKARVKGERVVMPGSVCIPEEAYSVIAVVIRFGWKLEKDLSYFYQLSILKSTYRSTRFSGHRFFDWKSGVHCVCARGAF